MGDPRLTRLPAPLLGYLAGCVTALAGVLLLWGLPVTLIVAGVVCAASFVLAYAGDEGSGR
ncbi:hypothetical protein ACFQE5_22280 [Pseudonocardia hispaniensis]|uniref:Uncharacterized protein n=1 Tax=Pseudonocardia hispaniensis TaxID=904933 RepID=A0ABW1J8M0_9PSEU